MSNKGNDPKNINKYADLAIINSCFEFYLASKITLENLKKKKSTPTQKICLKILIFAIKHKKC